jgi:hypothetical protein
MQLEKLQHLVAESLSRGCIIHDDIEFRMDEASGVGVYAANNIPKGTNVISVPFSQCITKEAVVSYDPLRQLFEETPSLLDYPDEVLCVGLLFALLKGDDNCPWINHVLSMPRSFDTPLFWTEEDLDEIKGHNIYHLTMMMKRQIANDFQSIFQPLSESYPDVLGGVDLDLYAWALSIVYSRSLDITRRDAATRIIVPVLDMVNHNPFFAANATDTFQYDEENDTVNFVSANNMQSGEELYAVYGNYCNSKLLYTYGFIVLKNPVKAIDLWTKVTPSCFAAQQKHSLLQSHPLTKNQTYDFHGTIRPGYISPALLATIRVIQADGHDLANINRAFEGRMLSVRNESASYVSLRNLLTARLKPETAEVMVGSFTYFQFCLSISHCDSLIAKPWERCFSTIHPPIIANLWL